jgi:hypothetical protein
MKQPPEDETIAPFATPGPRTRLPYVVEVWDPAGPETERVVARAATRSVAQTIFSAVGTEQPGRRVRLRRGGTVLSEKGVALKL